MSAYQAARAEATDYLVEADLHLARSGRLPSIPLPADTLRALLAGPPKPSVEEPVAWRVKDFADGWILCHTEAQARREAEGCGNLVQALYRSKTND